MEVVYVIRGSNSLYQSLNLQQARTLAPIRFPEAPTSWQLIVFLDGATLEQTGGSVQSAPGTTLLFPRRSCVA